MSGPVGMAVVLYRSVQLSPAMGLYFVVMISFALAIFNLLPLPVLDGGHVFMSLIEIVFRRPLPVMVVKVLSYIFVGLLIMLMLYVTYMDVLRVLPQSEKTAAEEVATQQAQP
jgi:regulator of sigma E protease